MITKNTDLINDNKQFWEKLKMTDSKFGERKREWNCEEQSHSCRKTWLTLLANYKIMSKKVLAIESNMCRLEQ